MKTRRKGNGEGCASFGSAKSKRVRRVNELLPSPEECETMGIPVPKPGDTTCLRCGEGFYSLDVKKFRLCPDCRHRWQMNSSRHMNEEDWRGGVL